MKTRLYATAHLFIIIAENAIPLVVIVSEKQVFVFELTGFVVPGVESHVKRIIDRQDLISVHFVYFTMPHLNNIPLKVGAQPMASNDNSLEPRYNRSDHSPVRIII